MATDVKINGTAYWNVSGFTLTEEANPIEPSDRSGAVAQFSFTLPETTNSKLLRDRVVNLKDGTQGLTQGTVAAVAAASGIATITANSRLIALNVIRTANPYIGTLEGALRYYFSLVGLNDSIIVDPAIANTPVTFVGWKDYVWEQIKALTGALLFDVSLVSNNIVCRPARTRVAQTYRDSAQSWTIDDSQIAQSITLTWYESSAITNQLVYPAGGWTTATPVLTVNAGESTLTNVPLSASITSVDQPVCQLFVDAQYSSTSVYSVTGNDGLPIAPAQWIAEGGSVSVKVGLDTRSLDITVTGSSDMQYSPYSIAVASGTSNNYSSLRLTGTGISYVAHTMTLQTGLTVDRAPTLIGVAIDNTYLTNIGDALAAGGRALAKWSGGRQLLTVTTTGINRVGDTGNVTYETIGDWKAGNPGLTMRAFDTANPGISVADFNAQMAALVALDFVNQGFGNYSGARVYNDYSWLRIKSSTPAAGTASYIAEQDTTVGDFKTTVPVTTIGAFKAANPGIRVGDFNVRPLLHS